MDERSHVFTRRKQLKDRSAVADVAGTIFNNCNNFVYKPLFDFGVTFTLFDVKSSRDWRKRLGGGPLDMLTITD